MSEVGPVVSREQCVELHRKLGRDAMLRQGDPVQTILDFAHSVWQEGFSEGYDESQAREQLAQFMIRNSFATGHGDTVADLLTELEWQLKERRD